MLFDSNAKEFHIATLKEDHEDKAREYAGYLKECVAAIEAGDLFPPPIPGRRSKRASWSQGQRQGI